MTSLMNKVVNRKECEQCGKEFETTIESQIFCTRDCSLAYKKQLSMTYCPLCGIQSKRRNVCKECRAARDISLKIRFEILQRDNFTCQYCGKNTKEDKIKLEIDHKIPISKGGSNNPHNLITSCSECNRGKGSILLNQTSDIQ